MEQKKLKEIALAKRKRKLSGFCSFRVTTRARQREVSVWSPIKLDKKLLRKSRRKFEKGCGMKAHENCHSRT
jgi:hypothetical protein